MIERERCKQRLYRERFSEKLVAAAASYRSVRVVRSCKELSADSSRGINATASLNSEARRRRATGEA
jgi:hypothetical protein